MLYYFVACFVPKICRSIKFICMKIGRCLGLCKPAEELFEGPQPIVKERHRRLVTAVDPRLHRRYVDSGAFTVETPQEIDLDLYNYHKNIERFKKKSSFKAQGDQFGSRNTRRSKNTIVPLGSALQRADSIQGENPMRRGNTIFFSENSKFRKKDIKSPSEGIMTPNDDRNQ